MQKYKYHHVGIPTTTTQPDEEFNEELKYYASGYFQSKFGIEWLRFEDNCPLHPLIKTVPHIAFVVDNLKEAISGKEILVAPNSPAAGVTVCFIKENGAPVEFLHFDKPEEEIWPHDKKLKIVASSPANQDKYLNLSYHHFGISTDIPREGEVYLKDYKLYCTDHESNPFGLQWMRYERTSHMPPIVKTVSHVAFQVDNLEEAIKGGKIIIKPNSPSKGIMVAFIEENGAPIEFLEYS